MTLIVGIQCSDGVVMASDSAATLGEGFTFTVGQQQVTKIRALENAAILYSFTGSIGMSQLIAAAIDRTWNEAFFLNAKPAEAMQKIAVEIAKTVQVYAGNAQLFQQAGGLQSALCKSLVAIPVKNQPRLFQFDYSGVPEEASTELPCVALGSGQTIADPFLAFLKRVLWKEREPTVAEGRFAAAWTLTHVIRTNPGGVGGPLQMATLTVVGGKPAIQRVTDVSEHIAGVEAAEAALKEQIEKSLGSGALSGSAVPRPT